LSPTRYDVAPALEDKAFILLVLAVSLAFALTIWPFFGAILWGTALAILFAPLHRRLLRRMRRGNLAAIITLLIIVIIVVIPVTLVVGLLAQEASGLYSRIQSGELDLGRYVQQVLDILPAWVTQLVDRIWPSDLNVPERLSGILTGAAQFIATRALSLGQQTLALVLGIFVMLYLLFFLLRDGDALAQRIEEAVPLRPELREGLMTRFSTVIRATIKGTLVVALVQGVLGGLALLVLGVRAPVLWGALMALLALLPAVGPPLVWAPIAIWFLATGSLGKGIGLAIYGIVVIGLVDNLLRPILVGRDTRIPDYVVLVSTLGGIAVFGLNGFIVGPVIAALFITVWEMFQATRTAPAEVHDPAYVQAPVEAPGPAEVQAVEP
jgi:predicted PurR-regulated permease PerM